jgi:flagella synthesis protein FlgN
MSAATVSPANPSAVPTVRAALRAELEGHRALLNILSQEQDALRRADPDAIGICASTKLRLIGELRVLARQRSELLIACGITLTATSVAPCDLPTEVLQELHEDWAALRAIAAEAQRVNALNGKLIARHQRHCESALSSLMNAAGRAAVYGADGRTERARAPQKLAAI